MSAQRSLSVPAANAGYAPRVKAISASRQYRAFAIALIAIDSVALSAALGLAYLFRFEAGIPFLEPLPDRLDFYSSLSFWAVPVWLVAFGAYRLYDRRYLFSGSQEYVRVINACTAGMVIIIIVSFLDITLVISRGWLLIVWLLSVLTVATSRFVARRAARFFRARGFLVSPTVIVGANEEGKALAEQFLATPSAGLCLLGFVDSVERPGHLVMDNLPTLGGAQDLERLVKEHGVGEIVVATTALGRNELLEIYRRFGHVDGVEIRLSSGLFEILTTGARVQEIGYVPLLTLHRVRITGVDAILKAGLDYVGSAIGLVLLSPLLLLLALLVKLDSPGPVFHRRRVLGRAGRPFDAFKFRTMVTNADNVLVFDPELRAAFESGYKLKVDPRITRLGRFLRRTSLDELPQLFNVLRGEMSLVGPRMIAREEVDRYGKWQLNLLTVKPGITGPWQVRGRSDIPYEERVRLSMHYIRNYTVWMDLEILLRTVPAVLGARGAY